MFLKPTIVSSMDNALASHKSSLGSIPNARMGNGYMVIRFDKVFFAETLVPSTIKVHNDTSFSA